MAKIQLNGKKITINQRTTVLELLKNYKIDQKKIAMELNGLIISRQLYKKKILKDKDKLEIVHFIGGG
jgi:sulfur carrier protein|tara:strand:- start:3050 stop:3253 length:204 start_codon:yes stop_codon:yes gene_type:complete